MPPKTATFVWENFGLHLGRLPAKSELCISEIRGLFLDSAPFFLKLLEKRKSFFSKILKKIGWTSHFPIVSHFWPEAPSPSTLLIFFSPTEFGTVHRIPFCRNSFDSFIFRYFWYVSFLFCLPFPSPSFPTGQLSHGRRRTPLPHSQLFSKNLKKSICAFHRF